MSVLPEMDRAGMVADRPLRSGAHRGSIAFGPGDGGERA
jgi:hypothetical protein